MAWKFVVLAVAAFAVALALDPKIGQYSRTHITILSAPPEVVRQELLGPDLIPQMHEAGKDTLIDAMRLARGGGPALEARAGDKIVLTDSNGTSSRTARVVANNETTFIWRVDRSWGQKVYHSFTFREPDIGWEDLLEHVDESTHFKYKRTWKGSAFLFHTRNAFPGWKWLIGESLPDDERGFGEGNVLYAALAEIRRGWEEMEERDYLEEKH